MSTAPRMLHVGMGPSPLREPLDRPRPAPQRTPRPVPEPVRRPQPGRAPSKARVRAARRRTAFLLFSGTVVGLLVFLLVTAQALLAQSAFRAEELQARTEQLQREQGQLRLRVLELGAPNRVASEARSQGMVLPDEIIPIPTRDEGVSMRSGAGKAPASGSPVEQGSLGDTP